MKKILLRLLVSAGALYALGGLVFAFLHYPAERPAWGQIVTDFNEALAGVFRKESPLKPAPSAAEGGAAAPSSETIDFAIDVSRISIPNSGSLSAEAARTWDSLRSLRDSILPEASASLTALAAIKTSDPAGFATQREALRATLEKARGVLEPLTASKMPLRQAEQLLTALATLEARWKAL